MYERKYDDSQVKKKHLQHKIVSILLINENKRMFLLFLFLEIIVQKQPLMRLLFSQRFLAIFKILAIFKKRITIYSRLSFIFIT